MNTVTSGLVAGLPSGGGILVIGVDNVSIQRNLIENNDFYGISVVDWCLAVELRDGASWGSTRPQRSPGRHHDREQHARAQRHQPPTGRRPAHPDLCNGSRRPHDRDDRSGFGSWATASRATPIRRSSRSSLPPLRCPTRPGPANSAPRDSSRSPRFATPVAPGGFCIAARRRGRLQSPAGDADNRCITRGGDRSRLVTREGRSARPPTRTRGPRRATPRSSFVDSSARWPTSCSSCVDRARARGMRPGTGRGCLRGAPRRPRLGGRRPRGDRQRDRLPSTDPGRPRGGPRRRDPAVPSGARGSRRRRRSGSLRSTSDAQLELAAVAMIPRSRGVVARPRT